MHALKATSSLFQIKSNHASSRHSTSAWQRQRTPSSEHRLPERSTSPLVLHRAKASNSAAPIFNRTRTPRTMARTFSPNCTVPVTSGKAKLGGRSPRHSPPHDPAICKSISAAPSTLAFIAGSPSRVASRKRVRHISIPRGPPSRNPIVPIHPRTCAGAGRPNAAGNGPYSTRSHPHSAPFRHHSGARFSRQPPSCALNSIQTEWFLLRIQLSSSPDCSRRFAISPRPENSATLPTASSVTAKSPCTVPAETKSAGRPSFFRASRHLRQSVRRNIFHLQRQIDRVNPRQAPRPRSA